MALEPRRDLKVDGRNVSAMSQRGSREGDITERGAAWFNGPVEGRISTLPPENVKLREARGNYKHAHGRMNVSHR